MPGPARIIALLAVATTAQPKIWRDLKERNERHMKQGRAARARPDHPRVAVHHSILRGSAQLTPRRNQDEQLPYLHYRKHELDYATHHAYVDLDRKLLYCAIPKVACTEFIRLMFRLEGDPFWWKDPHFRTDAPTLLKKDDGAEAEHILNDGNWTKVVFLRDPATRALSAYLDKFVDSPSRGIHGDYGLRHFKRAMNWTDFVDALASNNTDRYKPEGLHAGTNAHTSPSAEPPSSSSPASSAYERAARFGCWRSTRSTRVSSRMLHVDRCAADQTSLHFRQYLGFLACAGASVPLKPRVERTRMFSAMLSRRCCSYAESSAMAAAASPAAPLTRRDGRSVS